MKFKDLVILVVIGLVFNIVIAWNQHAPGYMDADYYFAGGLRLVQGHGFTETYLWNYLDNPQSLPHPSHAYWFPLASMVAAAGMFLTRQQTFIAARAGFILIAALVPPVSALLGYNMLGKRSAGLAVGLLGVFTGYHAPFMPTTDNFSLYMLLGGLFFLILPLKSKWAPLLLGLVAGLMNLSRVDGLIWFGLGVFGLGLLWFDSQPRPSIRVFATQVLIFTCAYLLVMGPWLARNISIWGTPLTPAGGGVLWMTRYDDTFAWPASRINLQNWLAAGWRAAIDGRLNALKLNFINTIGAQGSFLLFPLILVGIYVLRRNLSIRLALLGWFALFVIMSIVFPFAGSRGSFFHAGAALQPVWFSAALAGVEFLAHKIRSRGWFTFTSPLVYQSGLVMGMAILTFYLANIAIITNDWNHFPRIYRQVEEILMKNNARPSDVVIVANAPGYYVTTGRSAIIVPDENLDSVHALANKFGAKFLVLEKAYYTDPMIPVYQNPSAQPGLAYLGEFDDVRIYSFQP